MAANKKDVFELTELERFCLDAFVINDDQITAYRLSRTKPTKAEGDSLRRMADRYIAQPHVEAYINERRKLISGEVEDLSTTGTYRTTESIIAGLEQSVTLAQGKQKADILVKISEYLGLDKATVPEEERVHFYVPLPYCKDCPNKGKLGDGEIVKE